MGNDSIIERNIKQEYKYISLFKEKNYIKNTLATSISRFGDGIDSIAFSWLIYKITGSTLLIATLFAVNALPNLIFGITSGVLCKYISEKKIMAICDFGRGICVLLISILFITKHISIWHLYVITFLNSSFESFRSPSSISIMPKILKNENLEKGIAFNSSMTKVAELAGLIIAPLCISLLGLEGAIILDSITFITCGLIVLTLKLNINTNNNTTLTFKSYLIDLKAGFIYVKNNKFILSLCIFACIINSLFVPVNSFQAPYISEVFHGGSASLSVFSVSVIIGMTIAPIITPKVKEKLGGKNIFILGGILVGVMYILLALIGDISNKFKYIALSINMFLLATGGVFVNFSLQISMFKKIPEEYLSRVASIMTALTLLIVPVTSCIIGIFSKYIKLKFLFILFGSISTLLFILQNFNKRIRELNS